LGLLFTRFLVVPVKISTGAEKASPIVGASVPPPLDALSGGALIVVSSQAS
jgi:hypothetical protein